MSSEAITQPMRAPSLPRQLLVVEDDPIQQKAYQAVAKRYGIGVSTVSRTTDVLRSAMAEKPQAILLDYELEDGQSLKVLRTLKQSPETAEIPVAVVSGYLCDDTRRAIRACGEVPMLEKPWTVDQLLGLLLRLAAEVPSPPGRGSG